MPIEFVDRYTRPLVQASPDKLFVFGDNEARAGLGGQAAACRYEPNAVGITTKLRPNMHPNSFYTDADWLHWREANRPAFARLHVHLINGGTVVWPKDGIGTGLAELATRAPRILREIEAWLGSATAEFNDDEEMMA